MKQIFTPAPSLFLALFMLLFSTQGCETLSLEPSEFDWLVMGYQGELTVDEWLTSDTASLFRNDVYVENGSYVRHSDKTLNKILEWKIENDRNKGLYLSTKIKLDKIKPNFHIYRAQVAFKITDESRSEESITKAHGWPNWYTGIGYELVQAFSMRVPKGQSLDFPSSSSRDGLDDPTALQVWQNRTRFNEQGKRGNIPISIYLRGNQWMLKNEFDDTPFFEGAKFSGDSLGEAVPGEWLDLLIRMVPDDKNGLVEVYTRRGGEGAYVLAYEHKNEPFFGPIDARWYPSEIDTRKALGLPSYGIYPSTRFTHNRIKQWLDRGINSVEVHHTEVRLLQYPRGEAPMDEILRTAEKKF